MNLLITPASSGYPDEYLAARVRGRRSSLIHDWQPYFTDSALLPVAPDQDIWAAFTAELRWLYSQMNPTLRRTFTPVFVFFELQTFFVCLRFIAGRQQQFIPKLLTDSLLHEDIKEILTSEKEVNGLLPRLAELLITDTISHITAKQILNEYAEKGIRGMEQFLMNTYLDEMTSRKLHSHIAFFFGMICDIRNTITLAKQRRWQIDTSTHLVADGLTQPWRLKRRIMHETIQSGADISQIENRLLRSLARLLRIRARQPDTIAILLDYMWNLYLQAKNLGVLFHRQNIEYATLGDELIQ